MTFHLKPAPILTWLMILILHNHAIAIIDPYYKEVMERGYDMKGDSVIFPDGTSCLIVDFNNRTCGQKWMTSNYCIPEGGYVWDNNRCCEGLEPYLPEGVAGQPTCRKKILIKESTRSGLIIITTFIFATGIIFLAVRSKAKKNLKRKGLR
jgi:hypothetical protein